MVEKIWEKLAGLQSLKQYKSNIFFFFARKTLLVFEAPHFGVRKWFQVSVPLGRLMTGLEIYLRISVDSYRQGEEDSVGL